MRKEETMKKILSGVFILTLVLSISLLTLPVAARNNTIASSTMVFSGNLTHIGGGAYVGTLPMVQESVAGLGDGEDGFDVFAEQGGCAYCEGYYGTGAWNCGGTDTYLIGYYAGNDHDAYPNPGGPWGGWYDPDCADWDKYSLELTADHWYLRYTPTGESPMSGEIEWYGDGTGYAYETDPGTLAAAHGGSDTDPTEYTAGSAQEWGWHCGWGEERIPLQYKGFRVTVTIGASPDDVEFDPSNPVGWETYPVSNIRVLLPWIALGVAISAGASLLVLRRRRTQS
jgi:hypothetical protein